MILTTIEEDLGDKYKDDMANAWNKITTFIMLKLLEGMEMNRSRRNTLHTS